MTWKAAFDKGVAAFKHGQLDDALAHINQAAELEPNAFVIYDSRAAVHEKLGNLKAALLDSKRVIDLAPDRWQGYARSARLFDLLGKHGSAVKMADHALSRLRPEDVQRHAQLVDLRENAVAAQAAAEARRLSQVGQSSYHLGKLPVETLAAIFTVLIDEEHTWAVKLSHVCGHWRRILVNTPSAWQTLMLSKRHPLQKAKLWKQRAKNRIARISISMSPLDRAVVFDELQDLSWGNLSSLCISGDAFVELHRMLANNALPHVFSELDELTLLDATSSEQLSCWLSGPSWKLRVLHLSGALSMADEWWQRIQQLKELHLGGQISRLSTRIFTANPSLQRLVLDCPKIVGVDAEGDDGPVPMERLKSIECRALRNPFHVLRAITAPSVTQFGMHGAAAMADETLLHMAAGPTLVGLHVSNCSLGPSTLPMLLSLSPNLETLQINAVHAVANEMLQFLISKTADLPCRALKHVDVSFCSDLTTSSVHAFVKTRAQYASESAESTEKCAVIASLRVNGCPNIEPEMLPWFRSKVALFTCVYATKKDYRKDRRRYP